MSEGGDGLDRHSFLRKIDALWKYRYFSGESFQETSVVDG